MDQQQDTTLLLFEIIFSQCVQTEALSFLVNVTARPLSPVSLCCLHPALSLSVLLSLSLCRHPKVKCYSK